MSVRILIRNTIVFVKYRFEFAGVFFSISHYRPHDKNNKKTRYCKRYGGGNIIISREFVVGAVGMMAPALAKSGIRFKGASNPIFCPPSCHIL